MVNKINFRIINNTPVLHKDKYLAKEEKTMQFQNVKKTSRKLNFH